MAVASSSFQPSRIGFGSIIGAPLPAGRTWKYMCDALLAVGAPMRPSTVPPTMCEPFFRCARRIVFGLKRSGLDEPSKVEYAPRLALASRICSRPPACLACGRDGWAKRRSRSTAAGVATGSGELAATRAFLAVAATRAFAWLAVFALAAVFV